MSIVLGYNIERLTPSQAYYRGFISAADMLRTNAWMAENWAVRGLKQIVYIYGVYKGVCHAYDPLHLLFTRFVSS